MKSLLLLASLTLSASSLAGYGGLNGNDYNVAAGLCKYHGGVSSVILDPSKSRLTVVCKRGKVYNNVRRG